MVLTWVGMAKKAQIKCGDERARRRVMRLARRRFPKGTARIVETGRQVELLVNEKLVCAAWSVTAPVRLLENLLEISVRHQVEYERWQADDPVERARALLRGEW